MEAPDLHASESHDGFLDGMDSGKQARQCKRLQQRDWSYSLDHMHGSVQCFKERCVKWLKDHVKGI